MKQAIERLRQDSNSAICNGETILARVLKSVAEALEYQVECDAEVQAKVLTQQVDRSREQNVWPRTFGESVSRSARGLEAVDPGGLQPVSPRLDSRALGKVLEAARAEADNLREEDSQEARDIDAAVEHVAAWGWPPR